jgi:ribosomal protein L11 methyltransferase
VYFALKIDIPEEASELLHALLDASGPLGLEVRDRTLKPPPGAEPLDLGRMQIVAFYESETEVAEALRQVHSELPDAVARALPLQQEDWSETWKKHVHPVRVGRIWVGPSWERDHAGDAPIQVLIDPGMAFGTGDHATTALCLGELEQILAIRPGAPVLDVGTGTGILAIAARKLGAGRVVANDVDPVAVRIAKENAQLNGAPEIEITDCPIERIEGAFDIVVANLFANLLCQLAPRLVARTAPGGVLLLSGILGPQVAEVYEAFKREKMRLAQRRTSGEWALLALEHR